MRSNVVIFSNKVDQSHLQNGIVYEEFVFNEIAQIFPVKTINYLTNFLLQELNPAST